TKLVQLIGGNVNRIAESQLLHVVAKLHLALSAQDDHRMFVRMAFERAETAGRDLEVAHVEAGALAALADQDRPYDAAPVVRGRLVLRHRHILPAEAFFEAHDARARRLAGRGPRDFAATGLHDTLTLRNPVSRRNRVSGYSFPPW